MLIKERIRGYLPVVIDIETGGFDEVRNPILEICAIIITMDNNILTPHPPLHFHIQPFAGAIIDEQAIQFNGIHPHSALRGAIKEQDALEQIFNTIRQTLTTEQCSRAILVGHNAFFDLGFIKQASLRHNLKSPLHQFSTIDTLSLGALIYGETVLAKIIAKAGIEFDNNQAHSALYDTQKTAELFCKIFNNYPL